MSLYRVKLTIDTVVACEAEKDVRGVFDRHTSSILNSSQFTCSRIFSAQNLPAGWSPWKCPFGDETDSPSRTISEILNAKKTP